MTPRVLIADQLSPAALEIFNQRKDGGRAKEEPDANCLPQGVPKIDAARALMRHVLFFAEEKEMVARVFDSVLEFVSRVEVAQLVFTPDARAWELIG